MEVEPGGSMTKTEYRQYIASAEWQSRRKEFLTDKFECNRCSLPRGFARIIYDQDLHVHHVSYEHVGCELDADLEPLCRRCHDLETFGRTDWPELQSHACPSCSWRTWNPYSDLCERCLDAKRVGISIPHQILRHEITSDLRIKSWGKVWQVAINELAVVLGVDAIVDYLGEKESGINKFRELLINRDQQGAA